MHGEQNPGLTLSPWLGMNHVPEAGVGGGLFVSLRSQSREGKEPGPQAYQAVCSWTSHFPSLVLSVLIFKQRRWSLPPRGGLEELGMGSPWPRSLPEPVDVSGHSSPVFLSPAEARGGEDGCKAVGESRVAF